MSTSSLEDKIKGLEERFLPIRPTSIPSLRPGSSNDSHGSERPARPSRCEYRYQSVDSSLQPPAFVPRFPLRIII